MKQRSLFIHVALGLVGGAASVAQAQPYLINLSGATLLENFLNKPAATNDFIDADGDGIAGSKPFPNNINEQLCPDFTAPPTGHWALQYRAVGSVNGFKELVDFSDVYVTENDSNGLLKASVCSAAYSNRNKFITGGVGSGIFNINNPGGLPLRSTITGTYITNHTTQPTPTPGGVQIDIAPLDVPATWAVFLPGIPAFAATPGQGGYGSNPRTATNKDGSPLPYGNKLADLKDKNLYNPLNPGASNTKTLFDTPIAWAPIAMMTNLGTGYQQLDMSNVRHAFTTGRLMNGENIVAVTRDSGSGTRNGFNNTTCTDPSWGVGDNIGDESLLADEHKLGPDFQPSNKGGSGQMESTVVNHRLAFGYSGAERGVNNTWLTAGRAEIIAIRNDLVGGSGYHRPELNKILDNGVEGYNVGGPAAFVSLGDPKAEPTTKGGLNNGQPKMKNAEAAAYLNNITSAVASFVSDPGGDPTLFSPGEYLAINFLLSASTDFVPNPTNPCVSIPNPAFNANVQTYLKDISNSVYKNNAYKTFGTAGLNGFTPDRKQSTIYSDNNTGNNFVLQDATIANYLTANNIRNRISGDFSGNGARDINDAAEMMKAWKSRNGGPAWVAPDGTGTLTGALGTKASIEILGDFNGDGNFGRRWNGSAFVTDTQDVRYWADGLAIVAGKLDRKAGFTAVDNEFGGNFFGTTWGCGQSYVNGDSRFDIAGGSTFTARGWAPVGADGVIDSWDYTYILNQFYAVDPVSGIDWTNTAQAANADLSADVNGDLKIDWADLNELQAAGFCAADADFDCVLTIDDFIVFQTLFALGDPLADADQNGVLSIDDFIMFQTLFAIGC
jgi:hypothetical protein